MLIKRTPGWAMKERDATPEGVFHARRNLVKALAAGPILAPALLKMLSTAARAADADADPSAKLTEREAEVLSYLTKGYANKEIADRMAITVPTVRTHLRNIYEKLHVRSRTEAAVKYLQ